MKILMVCLGNICRSPLAEGILQHKAKQAGLDWQVRQWPITVTSPDGSSSVKAKGLLANVRADTQSVLAASLSGPAARGRVRTESSLKALLRTPYWRPGAA